PAPRPGTPPRRCPGPSPLEYSAPQRAGPGGPSGGPSRRSTPGIPEEGPAVVLLVPFLGLRGRHRGKGPGVVLIVLGRPPLRLPRRLIAVGAPVQSLSRRRRVQVGFGEAPELAEEPVDLLPEFPEAGLLPAHPLPGLRLDPGRPLPGLLHDEAGLPLGVGPELIGRLPGQRGRLPQIGRQLGAPALGPFGQALGPLPGRLRRPFPPRLGPPLYPLPEPLVLLDQATEKLVHLLGVRPAEDFPELDVAQRARCEHSACPSSIPRATGSRLEQEPTHHKSTVHKNRTTSWRATSKARKTSTGEKSIMPKGGKSPRKGRITGSVIR